MDNDLSDSGDELDGGAGAEDAALDIGTPPVRNMIQRARRNNSGTKADVKKKPWKKLDSKVPKTTKGDTRPQKVQRERMIQQERAFKDLDTTMTVLGIEGGPLAAQPSLDPDPCKFSLSPDPSTPVKMNGSPGMCLESRDQGSGSQPHTPRLQSRDSESSQSTTVVVPIPRSISEGVISRPGGLSFSREGSGEHLRDDERSEPNVRHFSSPASFGSKSRKGKKKDAKADNTFLQSERQEWRDTLAGVLEGRLVPEDSASLLQDTLSQARELAEELAEAASEAADTWAERDQQLHWLHTCMAKARNIMRDVPPDDHQGMLTVCGAMWPSIVEFSTAICESTCAGLKALTPANDDELRTVGRIARQAVDHAGQICSKLRDNHITLPDCDYESLLGSHVEHVVAALTSHAHTLQDTLLSGDMVMAGRQLAAGSAGAGAGMSAHEIHTSVRLLPQLWKMCAELVKHAGRGWPDRRLVMQRTLCECLNDAAAAATLMLPADMSELAESSDDECDTPVSSTTTVRPQGYGTMGVWGEGLRFGRGVSDEEVQAQSWVPSLLHALLTRSQEAHDRLRQLLTAHDGPDLSPELEEDILNMMDEMHGVWFEVVLGNTQRVAGLCAGQESLACWALEVLKDMAEQALRLVQDYDKCCLGLGYIIKATDDRVKVGRLFSTLKRSTDDVVNSYMRLRRLLKLKRSDQPTPSVAPNRARPQAAPRPPHSTNAKPKSQVTASIRAQPQKSPPPLSISASPVTPLPLKTVSPFGNLAHQKWPSPPSPPTPAAEPASHSPEPAVTPTAVPTVVTSLIPINSNNMRSYMVNDPFAISNAAPSINTSVASRKDQNARSSAPQIQPQNVPVKDATGGNRVSTPSPPSTRPTQKATPQQPGTVTQSQPAVTIPPHLAVVKQPHQPPGAVTQSRPSVTTSQHVKGVTASDDAASQEAGGLCTPSATFPVPSIDTPAADSASADTANTTVLSSSPTPRTWVSILRHNITRTTSPATTTSTTASNDVTFPTASATASSGAAAAASFPTASFPTASFPTASSTSSLSQSPAAAKINRTPSYQDLVQQSGRSSSGAQYTQPPQPPPSIPSQPSSSHLKQHQVEALPAAVTSTASVASSVASSQLHSRLPVDDAPAVVNTAGVTVRGGNIASSAISAVHSLSDLQRAGSVTRGGSQQGADAAGGCDPAVPDTNNTTSSSSLILHSSSSVLQSNLATKGNSLLHSNSEVQGDSALQASSVLQGTCDSAGDVVSNEESSIGAQITFPQVSNPPSSDPEHLNLSSPFARQQTEHPKHLRKNSALFSSLEPVFSRTFSAVLRGQPNAGIDATGPGPGAGQVGDHVTMQSTVTGEDNDGNQAVMPPNAVNQTYDQNQIRDQMSTQPSMRNQVRDQNAVVTQPVSPSHTQSQRTQVEQSTAGNGSTDTQSAQPPDTDTVPHTPATGHTNGNKAGGLADGTGSGKPEGTEEDDGWLIVTAKRDQSNKHSTAAAAAATTAAGTPSNYRTAAQGGNATPAGPSNVTPVHFGRMGRGHYRTQSSPVFDRMYDLYASPVQSPGHYMQARHAGQHLLSPGHLGMQATNVTFDAHGRLAPAHTAPPHDPPWQQTPSLYNTNTPGPTQFNPILNNPTNTLSLNPSDSIPSMSSLGETIYGAPSTLCWRLRGAGPFHNGLESIPDSQVSLPQPPVLVPDPNAPTPSTSTSSSGLNASISTLGSKGTVATPAAYPPQGVARGELEPGSPTRGLVTPEAQQLVAGQWSVSAEDEFWSIKWAHLAPSLVRKLGSGSYGQVWQGVYHGADVAIKVINIDFDSGLGEETVLRFKREVDLQRRLSHHPNVVRFIGACCEFPQKLLRRIHGAVIGEMLKGVKLAIVMELCRMGSLFDVIRQARQVARLLKEGTKPADVKRQLPNGFQFYHDWLTRLEVLRGAAAGVHFMHSHNVVHRDLTSYNLLLDYGKPWQVKVADFNLSRMISDGQQLWNSGNPNSPGWQSPELLKGDAYGREADVFSFGVIVWEAVTLREPWRDEVEGHTVSLYYIMNSVIDGKRLEFPPPEEVAPQCPELREVVQLAKECWCQEPSYRPQLGEVASRLTEIIGNMKDRLRKQRMAERPQPAH